MSTEYCSIYKAPELVEHFLAKVSIPLGFQIEKNPDEQQYSYEDYVTIDRSALDVQIVEEVRDSVIKIPDLTNPTKLVDMECKSKVRVIKLVGPLFYNVVATGFKPVAQAQIDVNEGEYVETPATAFSTSGTVEINLDLGYTCYECPFDPSQISGFKVTLTQDIQFILAETGSIIRNVEGSEKEEFFAHLDGKNELTINYPFTLKISSKDETPDPTTKP